jgi:gas vesicle protein
MSETPEEIRARIDRTRENVSEDVDALAEKVSPSSMVNRQTERVKGALGDVKDRIFGSDDDAYDSGAVGRVGDKVSGKVGEVGDRVGQVGDDVRQTADRAVQKAKGNPLAVGLIAFGVGALIASLIPASSVEKDAAHKVKDAAQPLVEEAKGMAQEVGENLKEPAQQAAQSVKDKAQSAGEHVKAEAQSAAEDVKSDAQDAKQRVQDETKR